MLKVEAAWWRPGSAFIAMLKAHDLSVLNEQEPFRWAGRLGGFDDIAPPDAMDAYADSSAMVQWSMAGWALKWYISAMLPAPISQPEVDVVAHSHGGQVAAFAAIYGARFRRLVTVSTPVRRDMLRQRRVLREYTQRWLHFYCNTDQTQAEGVIGDGELHGLPSGDMLNLHRTMPEADQNVEVPTNDHSRMLYTDPDLFVSAGGVAFLKS
jgi:hypothetical protein